MAAHSHFTLYIRQPPPPFEPLCQFPSPPHVRFSSTAPPTPLQILGFAKDRLGGTFPNSRCGAYFTPTTPSFDLTPHRMPIKVSKFHQNVNPTTRRGPVGHPADFRWLLLSPPFRTIFAYAEYFFSFRKTPQNQIPLGLNEYKIFASYFFGTAMGCRKVSFVYGFEFES